jgi:AcrR family transcriptional regulator
MKMNEIGTNSKRISNPDEEDARIKRTRLHLEQAVLKLAIERDITKASVFELTRRAGINRSTFYAHANSPMELLTKVLSRDLDVVRANALEEVKKGGVLSKDLTHRGLSELVEHVVRHEKIYAGVNRNSSLYALRVVVAEHTRHTIDTFLKHGFITPPSNNELKKELFSAFIAHGVAAAVEVWISKPGPRNPRILIEAIHASYPTWFSPSKKEKVSPKKMKADNGNKLRR